MAQPSKRQRYLTALEKAEASTRNRKKALTAQEQRLVVLENIEVELLSDEELAELDAYYHARRDAERDLSGPRQPVGYAYQPAHMESSLVIGSGRNRMVL